MFENVGRKVFFVVLSLLVALAFLLGKQEPFRLGLDLEGGTRLVYRLNFDKLEEEGQLTGQSVSQQNRAQLLADTISIIRNRVDPKGVLEPVIRPEGTDRIVIELPGTFEVQGDPIVARLEAGFGTGGQGTQVTLAGDRLDDFPGGGGLIKVDEEVLRYASRDGSTLFLTNARGQRGTSEAPHAAGARVELVSDDAIRARIESLGDLAFLIAANPADYTEFGTDPATERSKLEAWVAAHPGLPVVAFNKEKTDGPDPHIAWFPRKQDPDAAPSTELQRAEALLRPQDADNTFRGSDLSRVYPAQDSLGYPAVGFEMKVQRKSNFGDFTEKNLNRQMAIVLNVEIASSPSIDERLPGAGIIRGQFSPDEVRDLMTILRSGSLKIAPELEYEEVVGPTLGADYVRRGFLSGILALVVVLAFMVVYYRKLGVFAAISLLINFTLLLGGLSFLDATLTLPGIAGIILTVGMAVDANILIFDRIREEADKGRNAKQAAKTGFEKALSAILDANITTFLTAVILYRIGTGPVRGFAVTLMIGIVTSVFAALLITRVMVHLSLSRSTKPFSVGTWMVKASYDFLGKTKPAIVLSSLAILLGIGLFFQRPPSEKLGIDFTGGAEVHLRTDQPQGVDLMRARIKAIPGTIGSSAEVKPILNSAVGEDFTDFRAIFKTLEDGSGDFVGEIRAALSDVLLKDGIQLTLAEDGVIQKVNASLFFEEPHPTTDLEAALGKAGLTTVAVQAVPDRANAYTATAEVPSGQSVGDVVARVKAILRDNSDTNGSSYRLATPIPSSSLVGPQVVGELRDKALLALAISLFVTVMYIRVRFAEYSYGFAAVVAVLHDVLITLGMLTFVNEFGILNGEISLPMIAAFLTIIGYSLNDTIVIFDRVRENLPRTKASFRDCLNLSINQTLSRTVLTSLTTFLAVACLFAFNYGTGNVLESFSFAMMVGVVTGTYSTIFVANPILLWLETRNGEPRLAGKGGTRVAAKAAGSAPAKA